MKAKCPHCKDGCDKCEDGFFEVKLAEGNWFTRACTNPMCGFHNGVRISKSKLEGTSAGACAHCKSPANWICVAAE